MSEIAVAPTRDVRLAGGLLGFALGGFFDGILLHQILQWHHLLSAIDPGDVRMQVVADGLFHALMYAVALLGLWQLCRIARRTAVPTMALLAALLWGFGGWHLVDAVLFHWLLGIHRVRMDTASPLFWDLLWLAAFGFGPLAIAIMLSWHRRPRARGASKATLGLLAALVVGAGYQAMQAPGEDGFTTVLLIAGSDSERLFSAAASVDARVAWTDGSGRLVVLSHRPGERSALVLLAHGALALDTGILPAGCFAWLRGDPGA
jgi:uncharacterized membrane protein